MKGSQEKLVLLYAIFAVDIIGDTRTVANYDVGCCTPAVYGLVRWCFPWHPSTYLRGFLAMRARARVCMGANDLPVTVGSWTNDAPRLACSCVLHCGSNPVRSMLFIPKPTRNRASIPTISLET